MKSLFLGLYWISVFLIAGLVAHTKAQCTPSAVNVHLGSNLVLKCEGLHPVTWSDNNEVSSQLEIITSPSNNAGVERSWLIYRNATNSDSRITCSTGGGSCFHSVTVFTVPSDVHITDSGLTANTVERNSSTILNCSASGTVPHQYKWYHNGTTISGATSSSYAVTSAQFSSAGVYTCEVSNWAGTSSGTYTLRVQVVPTISSLTSSAAGNKIILPRTGSTSVTITCTASGDVDSVSFQWTLNNGTVADSIVSATNSGNQVIGRLLISAVKTAHGGTYTCSTGNNVESDSQELTLAVVEPPTVVAITVNGSDAGGVVHALNGTRSDFACIVSGTSPLNTSWELQTTRGDINRVGTEFNRILTQGDEGNYTCAVVNTQEGLSDNATVTVNVFDPISLTSAAMTTLEHKENDQVTLRCSFFRDPEDPVPFPQVTWTGPSISTTVDGTQTTQNSYESTLNFTATRQHHGQFTCSVNDTRVGTIEALFDLTVYYPPTDIALLPANPSVTNGSSTTFTCTGNGRPPPEFNITRSFPDGTSSTISGATFVLHPSSKEELGINLLTCSATNSEYTTPVHSVYLNITIRGAPEVVNSSSIQVISRSFTSVSVQWTQPQDNFDTIQYYQIRLGECETSNHTGSPCQLVRIHQLPYNSSRYLSLNSLSPFTTYTLEIAAGNVVGFGPYSNAVVIRTVQQDEATVKKFTAVLRGGTIVLFQWHADVNLTQTGTAFSYFRLTRLRQGFIEQENVTLSLADTQCPSSTMPTEICFEWEGFAAGAVYSVWIEMVYSYPATGGRVNLTVTIPTDAESILVSTVAGGATGGFVAVLMVVVLVVLILVVLGCRRRRKQKGGGQFKGGSTDKTAVSLEKVNYSFEEEGNTIKASGTISGGGAYEQLQVDQVAHHSYSKCTFGQAAEGSLSHTNAAYEPLQVGQVAHHSYSECTFGQAAEGGQDGGYAPLDVTKRQDTGYTVPVVGQKAGQKNEYANSLHMRDHEYLGLEDATPKKTEPHESKKGPIAFKKGAAMDTKYLTTGYTKSGCTPGEDSNKAVTKGKREEHFAKKVLKGKPQEHPPTMAKPNKPKVQSRSESAAATEVNVHVPCQLAATLPAQAPPPLVAKAQLEATAQDSKKKKSSKPAVVEKNAKKPILPKHVTAATASPPSSLKGRTPASTAPPLVTKKTPAKGGGSASTGGVSVAELAKRLEKEM